MEQVNPYAAPKADVSEADPRAAPLSPAEMLFSFEGRIGRGQYWLYALACTLVFMVLIGAVGFVIGLLAKPDSAGTVTMVIVMLLYLPLLYMLTALQAKRWHDRGKSAWWMLLALVPLANIWAAIEAGFLPGTPGRNEYGLPPR